MVIACAAVCMNVGAVLVGCPNGSAPALSPTVLDPGRCILDTMSNDLKAHMSEAEAAADAALRCLGNASPASVSKTQELWQAHKAAELRELDAGAEQ